ncbi:MAG: phosphatidylserine/phosphatidylglycerophosphate/cardiolipin synthase family protein [Roseibacillus sp.]|jgi:cardiolipin synthase
MSWRSRTRPLLLSTILLVSSCGHQHDTQVNGLLTSTVQLTGMAARMTAVANLRSPFTSTNLGLRMLVQRTEELVRGNIPFLLDPNPRTTGAPGSREFSASLTRLGLPQPVSGTVELLIDGPEFFPALDEELRSASQSIDIQIYIWDNDDISVRYADLVRERARAVPVRVLIDDVGSTVSASMAPHSPPPTGFRAVPDIVTYLRRGSSSVQVRRILNPWLVLDHCKLLVFDGETALLGGMNIGREYYSEWHDLMVRVRGPIVDQLQPEFEKKWRHASPWGDLALLRRKATVVKRAHAAPPGSFPIRVLSTNMLEGRREPLVAMLEAIRASRTRIWLENEYITSDRILDALLGARRRGVEVRVIIPDMPSEKTMNLANHEAAGPLIQAGAEVYRYPGMTHMKAMICDGWATVGAANLDTHSLQISYELNISYSDPKAVRDLARRVFHKDFANSKRLTLEDTRSLLNPLVEPFTDQL